MNATCRSGSCRDRRRSDRAPRPLRALAAFYRAMVELLELHGHLALAAETGERRYSVGAYRAWQLHVDALLKEAGLGRRRPGARGQPC